MNTTEIFGLQFILSLLVFGLLAAWLVRPALARLDPAEALFWLTIPHAFRHIGMVFEVPGVVAPDMPANFSFGAAYGDLAAGLLAIAVLVALRYRWTIMLPLAWLLSVVGLADLAVALTHIEAVPYFQSAWYIPTFLVPLLLVSHILTVQRLLTKSRKAPDSAPAENG